MKILKLFIIGMALLVSHGLFAQNVIVNNNTILTNGTAIFNFAAPTPPAVCTTNPAVAFLSYTAGNSNTTFCTGLTLIDVIITFDDPMFPCVSNPQIPITLTPTSSTGFYTDCPPAAVPPSIPPPPTTYNFNLMQVGADWVLTIN